MMCDCDTLLTGVEGKKGHHLIICHSQHVFVCVFVFTIDSLTQCVRGQVDAYSQFAIDAADPLVRYHPTSEHMQGE